jgi:tRNA-dependent cyclodipeptide synthase
MQEEMITIPKSVYNAERKMRIFGADANEIYQKRHNIFIGISISNKKITPNMALNYLKWAVRNTKKYVAVIIADELNIINYRIFDGYSSGKAENRAKTVGDKFEYLFLDTIKQLQKKDQSKVKIYRWSQIKNNNKYQKVHSALSTEYKTNSDFKSAVLYFIRKYMRKKGKIITNQKDIDKLATYIIGELPTLLEGINVDKNYYSVCIYPTYFASGMSQFVMDIHADELKISKKTKNLIKRKAILIEAWLD